METKLSRKQERFVQEYVKDLNATAAARRAGYSSKTAHVQGPRLLGNVIVKTRIAQLLGSAKEQAELSLVDVLNELKTIATATMADFATWTEQSVRLKPSGELSRELQACIESVAETSGKDGRPQLRIKFYSKLQAIQTILKIHELSELEARIAALEESIVTIGQINQRQKFKR